MIEAKNSSIVTSIKKNTFSVPFVTPVSQAGNQESRVHRVNIRWMVRRDLTDVLKIEQKCFEYPWSEEDFMTCLYQRNCVGMVAEHQGKIVGFMVYELGRHAIQLLNFGINITCRHQKIGTRMIKKLIGKLRNDRRTRISCAVRERNLPAQLFFRELGFRAVSVARNYYEETQEDAYLMQYRLSSFRS